MLKSGIGREYGNKTVMISDNEHFEKEAVVAVEFMTKWGCVAAAPEGEDSSGRAKLRLMTEKELVDRSFMEARLFMEGARERNLIFTSIDLPEEPEKEKG